MPGKDSKAMELLMLSLIKIIIFLIIMNWLMSKNTNVKIWSGIIVYKFLMSVIIIIMHAVF